jgi:molybdopterin molybdotransferase
MRTRRAGQAVRIFTGAPVPAGADLVVIQEERRPRRRHRPLRRSTATRRPNIRPAGGDFRPATYCCWPGARIDPWRLCLVASAGLAEVRSPAGRAWRSWPPATSWSRRAPVPASRPDLRERLVQPGGPDRLLGRRGLSPERPGRRRGRHRRGGGAVEADLIVTVGGASVGDHDLVKPASPDPGPDLAVETIAVRPGKPTWFGTPFKAWDGRRVLGLPGNPASALVCAELFLRPLLAA